jgi:type IV secretory pathway VirB9-like protein
MKKTIYLGILVVFLCTGVVAATDVKDVLQADFNGTKSDNVYQIVTKIGCHTTLELPSGKKIKHFIIGDQKLWKAESDGKYAFVKPIQAGIETTISIITTDEKMFQFTVVEASAIGENSFHKKVKIIYEDDEPMIKRVAPVEAIASRSPSDEELKEKTDELFNERKIDLIKKLDYRFKIKKNKFDIKAVYQDGVFTFIDLSKTQIRPAVFLTTEKEKEKLEPVNFTDDNGIYTIHRILAPGECFILKNGTKYSKIFRTN